MRRSQMVSVGFRSRQCVQMSFAHSLGEECDSLSYPESGEEGMHRMALYVPLAILSPNITYTLSETHGADTHAARKISL